ncbi:MAG: hypothetical protein H0V43_00235, partial [Gemmatimonadales bacterium]|nr:hypothetical protein [Gemmatimonadales bacterium]
MQGYKRFLVKSPLQFVPPTDAQAAVGFPGYGSFHQQYRLDGKLICVGVIGKCECDTFLRVCVCVCVCVCV